MTDEFDSLVVEHMKALRNPLREFRAEFQPETENLRFRMSSLETAMSDFKRQVTADDEEDALHQVQLDQIVERVRRIRLRLELS